MRSVPAAAIAETVARLCIEANTRLPADVAAALAAARAGEDWPCARETLGLLEQNLCAAAQNGLPICQDTGMACVFVRLGGGVHIEGNLVAAVNEGVQRGYQEGFLRKSIVADPLRRENTGDNTPAMLTVEWAAGEGLPLVWLPAAGHNSNTDAPERVNALIEDFVRRRLGVGI